MGKNAKRRREGKRAASTTRRDQDHQASGERASAQTELMFVDGRGVALGDFLAKGHVGDKPVNLNAIAPPTVARLGESGGTPRQIWEGQLVHYLWWIEDLDFPDLIHVLRAEYGFTMRDAMWACRWGMPSGPLVLPSRIRATWLGATVEGDVATAPLGELLDAFVSCDPSCDVVAALLACGAVGVDLPDALHACYWTLSTSWQSLRLATEQISSMSNSRTLELQLPSAAMPKRWSSQLRRPEAAFIAAGMAREEFRQLEHRPSMRETPPLKIERATPSQVSTAWAGFQEAALLHEHARSRWNEMALSTARGLLVNRSELRSVLEIGLEAAKEYASVVGAVEELRARHDFALTTTPLPEGHSIEPRGAHPARPRSHGPPMIRDDWSMPEVYSRLADAWGVVSASAITLGDEDLGVRSARLALVAAEHSCSDYDVGRRLMHLATCLLLAQTRDALHEARTAIEEAENRLSRAGAQKALATARYQRARLKRLDLSTIRQQMATQPLPPSTGFGIGRLPPL